MSEDSDDEFDLTQVKLEVDEEFDISKLKKEVDQNNTADVDQLEEIERKEDEELDQVQGYDAILHAICARASSHGSNINVKDFIYDKEKHRWCCIKFEVPVRFKNMDMTNILREAARGSIIWEVPKIKRAFAHKQNDVLMVTTDGINIGVSQLKEKNKLRVFN